MDEWTGMRMVHKGGERKGRVKESMQKYEKRVWLAETLLFGVTADWVRGVKASEEGSWRYPIHTNTDTAEIPVGCWSVWEKVTKSKDGYNGWATSTDLACVDIHSETLRYLRCCWGRKLRKLSPISSCQINSQIHARRASDIHPCDRYIRVFAPHVHDVAVLTLETLKQS